MPVSSAATSVGEVFREVQGHPCRKVTNSKAVVTVHCICGNTEGFHLG